MNMGLLLPKELIVDIHKHFLVISSFDGWHKHDFFKPNTIYFSFSAGTNGAFTDLFQKPNSLEQLWQTDIRRENWTKDFYMSMKSWKTMICCSGRNKQYSQCWWYLWWQKAPDEPTANSPPCLAIAMVLRPPLSSSSASSSPHPSQWPRRSQLAWSERFAFHHNLHLCNITEGVTKCKRRQKLEFNTLTKDSITPRFSLARCTGF